MAARPQRVVGPKVVDEVHLSASAPDCCDKILRFLKSVAESFQPTGKRRQDDERIGFGRRKMDSWYQNVATAGGSVYNLTIHLPESKPRGNSSNVGTVPCPSGSALRRTNVRYAETYSGSCRRVHHYYFSHFHSRRLRLFCPTDFYSITKIVFPKLQS